MRKICLRTGGLSRRKYVGAVDPLGLAPFRLNVGPDEVFEVCNPDGTSRESPLLHGQRICLRQSGRYFDLDGPRLADSITQSALLTVEKQDPASGRRICDGDAIALRSEPGWLVSDCERLWVDRNPDWRETQFQIHAIPEFAPHEPIALLQDEQAAETIHLGPHGRPFGAEVEVRVKLNRSAPPGGIVIGFLPGPAHHVCIPDILIAGSSEGRSRVYFSNAAEIPETGIAIGVGAKIACTGERAGEGIATVQFSHEFGRLVSLAHARGPSDRRGQDRRGRDRRCSDRRLFFASRQKFGYSLCLSPEKRHVQLNS